MQVTDVKPLRAAMVCSQGPPVYGGAGTQALGLAKELVGRQIEVDYYTQNQLQASRREDLSAGLRIFRAPGEASISRLPPRLAEVARSASFLTWLFIKLFSGKYDVIHLHGSYWFGVPAALAARIRRTPLIVKVTRLGEDDAVTVVAKQVGPVRIGKIYGYALKRASVAIALSEEIEKRHREVFPDNEVKLIPNGVDVDRFQSSLGMRRAKRADLGISDGEFVLLFVGYLAPHKGVTTLLGAWEKCEAARGGRLLLVGPSAGFYRELEESVAEQAHGARAVTVLNHVKFTDMPALYAAADMFVLPTQAEGMPNSLLEALAAGLPVVVSKVPGVTDVIAHASGVTTVEPVDVDTLARRIDGAYAKLNPAVRAPRLPPSFSLSRVADEYEAMYKKQSSATHRGSRH